VCDKAKRAQRSDQDRSDAVLRGCWCGVRVSGCVMVVAGQLSHDYISGNL